MNADELRAAIAGLMPGAIEDLARLVRIPSIAFPGYDGAPVRASAEATAEILEAAGFGGVRLIELPDGVPHPAVYGEVRGPAGAPTMLLYAHHDVQPEGPLEEWTSPPFSPEVRDGRLFGRGSSDDKCGIVLHAAALRAWDGTAPINVKVIVEGEEETSTEHLPFLIEGHTDLLAADVVGIADGGNWRTGIPALETSIRGVVDCRVTVRVLDLAVHSDLGARSPTPCPPSRGASRPCTTTTARSRSRACVPPAGPACRSPRTSCATKRRCARACG
jgi:acetylornithine deacetylase/succinyl-diaminopimelate desuccinylase-like protein